MTDAPEKITSGTDSKETSVKMFNPPDRISISPVYRQKRDDDFYLVDRSAFPGKGTEYIRADIYEALEVENKRLREALKKLRRRGDSLETYNSAVDEIVTAALEDKG